MKNNFKNKQQIKIHPLLFGTIDNFLTSQDQKNAEDLLQRSHVYNSLLSIKNYMNSSQKYQDFDDELALELVSSAILALDSIERQFPVEKHPIVNLFKELLKLRDDLKMMKR